MDDISQALASALQFHQAGKLADAERLYRGVLARQPDHPQALRQLGVAALQQRRPAEAVELLSRALATVPDDSACLTNLGTAYGALQQRDKAAECFRRVLEANPDSADAHYNLGTTYAALSRWDEALDHLRRAVAIDPRRVDAHFNLGNTWKDMRRFEDAERCYREVIRQRPQFAAAHNNLGVTLQARGRFDEALPHFSRATAIDPNYAMAHNNLGVTLHALGQWDEAVACFERALRLNPDMANAHYNLGNVWKDRERYDEAERCYRETIRLQSGLADAHNSLGMALQAVGRFDEARACYEEALRLDPRLADAYNNLGVTLHAVGRLDEANAYYEQALRLDPQLADAHHNRAFVFLSRGDFANGWPGYEWRLKCKDYRGPKFRQPMWDGSPLGDRTLLVYAEQGLGDTLQFIRYIPLVRRRGGRVWVQVPRTLVPLLTTSGYENLIPVGSKLPDFDVQVPLLSLPGIFGTTLETIPHEVPYLAADPKLLDHWRQRLAPFDSFKIGIVWQGNPKYTFDRFRSIPLAAFAPLAKVPGVRLFSLQKGLGTVQIAAAKEQVPLVDLDPELDRDLGAFTDTAAVIKNLDVVIGADTCIVTLAAALGMPAWMAMSSYPEWRWLIDREDSPWYPTMRLFRQRRLGEWSDVFDRIAAALAALVAG